MTLLRNVGVSGFLSVGMDMAIIKMKGVRGMGDKELGEKLSELRLELSKERASSEIGTVKNPGRIREIRRAIARILTEKGDRKRKTGGKK